MSDNHKKINEAKLAAERRLKQLQCRRAGHFAVVAGVSFALGAFWATFRSADPPPSQPGQPEPEAIDAPSNNSIPGTVPEPQQFKPEVLALAKKLQQNPETVARNHVVIAKKYGLELYDLMFFVREAAERHWDHNPPGVYYSAMHLYASVLSEQQDKASAFTLGMLYLGATGQAKILKRTPLEIAKDFEGNRVRAEQTYTFNRVRISEKLQKVARDDKGMAYALATFPGGSRGPRQLMAYPADFDESTLSSMAKGDAISIVGRVAEYRESDYEAPVLLLSGCAIVKQENAP